MRAGGPGTPQFYRPDPDVGWRPRPGVSGWIADPSAIVAMNRAGYRDIDHPLAKPPHTYRIVLLGNSMSEAVEMPLDDTYWRRLVPLLQACRTDGAAVEVISFAVNGYDTAQEYLTLKQWALKYQPDLVLLAFFTGTDLADDVLALGRHQDRPYFALEDGRVELVRRPGGQPTSPLTVPVELWSTTSAWSSCSRAARRLHDTIKYGLADQMRVETGGLDKPGVPGSPTAPDWDRRPGMTEELIHA